MKNLRNNEQYNIYFISTNNTDISHELVKNIDQIIIQLDKANNSNTDISNNITTVSKYKKYKKPLIIGYNQLEYSKDNDDC